MSLPLSHNKEGDFDKNPHEAQGHRLHEGFVLSSVFGQIIICTLTDYHLFHDKLSSKTDDKNGVDK